LRDIIKKESQLGKKPFGSDFHMFGRITFAHIPKEKRSNLDEKSKAYMFIGYNE